MKEKIALRVLQKVKEPSKNLSPRFGNFSKVHRGYIRPMKLDVCFYISIINFLLNGYFHLIDLTDL